MDHSIEFIDYEKWNRYNAQRSPSTVHVTNTGLSWFFQRQLLQKLLSNFVFEGIPENWPLNYFMYVLFLKGFIGVVKTKEFGVIPLLTGLWGKNVFYQPTHLLITNPLLRGILQPKIGTQAALIKMQPDYIGAWDLITFYADNMALCAEAAGVNMVNSKLAYVFTAENKNAAESLKKLYDQISEGNPAVFADKELFNADGAPAWAAFQQNLKQNYIADSILDTMIKWEVRFNTEVGIPNVNMAKASGVSDMEVEANTMETQTKAELWRDTIQEGLEEANRLFGLNMSVRLKSQLREEKALDLPDNVIAVKNILKEKRGA